MSWYPRIAEKATKAAGLLMLASLLAVPLAGQAPKPDAAKPDAAKPDAPKPDAPKPDAAKAPDAQKDSSPSTKGSSKPDSKASMIDPATGALIDPNGQAEYKLSVGDSFAINVWKEPEVSGEVQIRGDCRITLPLIKDVEVCGMTPTEIQDLLVDKLGKFIAAPDVTIIPRALNSRKVYFIGNVRKPGGMVLNGPITIAQALSDAGGLAEFANDKKVIIRRPKNGSFVTFFFNYRNYLRGTSTEGNILLEPGDTIIVK
jgi:polysaccharide export outer membrane protein